MERRLITANEVVKRTVRWLWAGRIPCGAITILEGDPGIGKSVLTYDLAARITSGRPMPDSTESMPSAGAVLLQAEDSLSGTVIPNLQTAGANLQKVILLDKDRFATQQFSLSSDLPLVEKAIVEVEAKFVVIDPLTAFFETNTNADVSVRRVLGPLTRLAERYELAILLVRHLRKSGARNSLYSGAGSIGIIAAARSGLVVGHDPSSDNKYQQVLALNKSNMADASSLAFQTVKQPDGAITIEWLGASQYSANDINAAASLAEEYPILREAMYVLYAILSEGSIPAIDVIRLAKHAGICERTLKRAKRVLQVESRKKGSGYGSRWFWKLPENEELLRPLKNKDMGELMDRLIYGDSDMASRDGTWNPHGNSTRKDDNSQGDNDADGAVW
jgi:hypothetical protein